MTFSDTSREASGVQIAVLRDKSAGERLHLTMILSETTIALSRRAIKRAHPELSEEDVRCKFIELHYGKDLADRVRQYLKEQQNE